MTRMFLLAAASAVPLLLVAAGEAGAVDTISSSTSTPVATATATNGAPDNIDISSGGSIGVTVPGAAVTLNSSNLVTNEGQIGFTAINNAVGIQIQGGNTGSVTNTGSILITDNYTANTDNNTGLLMPPFAQGTNRTGIQVVGPGIFNGFIDNFSTITVHGDNSFGVDIQAPITGDFQSLQVTPATSGATASVLFGSITVLGGEPPLNGAPATAPTIGFHVAPAGGVGGNVTLGNVSATGYGAQAVAIDGTVGGAVALGGTITSTGYESTARSSYPTIGPLYTAQELELGGAAVTIGGSVGGGIIITAPPLTAITNASTASDLINGVSVPQTLQGAGGITTYGSAPALVIGSAANNLVVGVVGANNTVFGEAGSGAYGLVNQGSISANGVYDQLNYPNLPAPVSATALQIGAGGAYSATITGGVYNTGAIGAQAYQANATAIHVLAGGSTPLILNDGVISASSLQENSTSTVVVNTAAANGVTQTVVPANVYGILIEPGATVSSVVNNSAITANLTGAGGVGGTVATIVDRSGTLASVVNTGSISAQATQTLLTVPMPVTATAIDMSAGTGVQSVTQMASTNSLIATSAAYNNTLTYNPGQIINYQGVVYQATTTVGVAIDPIDYPTYWRQVGALDPYITGSILLGSGGSTVTVSAGTVNGPIINLGTGSNNAITVNGPAGGSLTATSVTGAIEEVSAATAAAQVVGNGTVALQGGGNGTLSINVDNGTLNDLNPSAELVNSVNVGPNGLLKVAADPANGAATRFIVTGASTFAPGAQIGVSLLSIPRLQAQTYVIVQTAPGGTLTAGTFINGPLSTAPWLYTANAAYVPAASPGAPGEIQLTVAQKSTAQIGFNGAEASALDAVLAAAPANPAIQNAILSQTTEAGLKSVYDQLLPSQGQGLFDALDAAAQAVGAMTGTAPEAASRVAGTSLWLQEVNERVDRSGSQTLGSYSKLFGVVAGYEHTGAGGGAAGLTLAYFNADDQLAADLIGTGVTASMVEAGGYYRRSIGRFSFGARAAVGYSWFANTRVFATITPGTGTNSNSATGTELQAHSNWGGVFYDGHLQAVYEQPLGRFYARPEISADFLELNEGSHGDTGGGNAFDLNVASRNSNRVSGQAIMVLGRQWGQAAWFRTEVRGGYREILAGTVGDTVASFSGGNPFTLAPENDRGGWLTAGFSLKGGSEYSYLALEGDVDLRAGEQRYDLRIAGRSIF